MGVRLDGRVKVNLGTPQWKVYDLVMRVVGTTRLCSLGGRLG